MVPKLMRYIFPFIDPENYRAEDFSQIDLTSLSMFLFFLWPVLILFWLTLTASGLKWFLCMEFWSLVILQWLPLFEETIQRAAPSLFAFKAALSQSPSILSYSCKMAWLFLPSHTKQRVCPLFFIYLFWSTEADWTSTVDVAVSCLQRWTLAPFWSSLMHLGLMLLMEEERGHVWLEDFHLVLLLLLSHFSRVRLCATP